MSFFVCSSVKKILTLYLKLYFFTGGGACVAGAGGGGVSSLNLPNVAGVFLVTVAGCIAAS